MGGVNVNYEDNLGKTKTAFMNGYMDVLNKLNEWCEQIEDEYKYRTCVPCAHRKGHICFLVQLRVWIDNVMKNDYDKRHDIMPSAARYTLQRLREWCQVKQQEHENEHGE